MTGIAGDELDGERHGITSHTGSDGTVSSLAFPLPYDLWPYYDDMVSAGCIVESKSEIVEGKAWLKVWITGPNTRRLDIESMRYGSIPMQTALTRCVGQLLLREPWLGWTFGQPKPDDVAIAEIAKLLQEDVKRALYADFGVKIKPNDLVTILLG